MRTFAICAKCALTALAACLVPGGMAHADAQVAGSVPPGWVYQGVWQDGRWTGQWMPGPGAAPGTAAPAADPPAVPSPPAVSADPDMQRMIDRCRNYHHDSVAGGAVIGGVVGGVIGNRLTPGDRVAGTVGGAAVGAVAGAAIEDAGNQQRDRECAAFFARHPEWAASPAPAVSVYPPALAGAVPTTAPAYGPMVYAPMGYMMVPVITVAQPPCVETRTVTTSYVEDRRPRVIRVVRWVEVRPHRKEKRVYTGS